MLGYLAPTDFAQLRPNLGRASGAQSRQLRRFYAYVGLSRGSGSLLIAFQGALARRGMALHEVFHPDHRGEAVAGVAESLLALAESTWEWQLAHTRLTYRMLGNAPGTGGTQGVDHLLRRSAFPFQELWDARGRLHDPPADA